MISSFLGWKWSIVVKFAYPVNYFTLLPMDITLEVDVMNSMAQYTLLYWALFIVSHYVTRYFLSLNSHSSTLHYVKT